MPSCAKPRDARDHLQEVPDELWEGRKFRQPIILEEDTRSVESLPFLSGPQAASDLATTDVLNGIICPAAQRVPMEPIAERVLGTTAPFVSHLSTVGGDGASLHRACGEPWFAPMRGATDVGWRGLGNGRRQTVAMGKASVRFGRPT